MVQINRLHGLLHGDPRAILEREHMPAWAGSGLGIGAGVAVGAAVWRAFIAFQPREIEWTMGFGLALGLLATVCTGLGAWGAHRSPTTHRAVLFTFLANVAPPTLICAPTIIGLFFSVPAGLLAFVTVLPVTLLARRFARPGTPGWDERERLVGAGFALFSAASMTAFQATLDSGDTSPFDLMPTFVAVLAAVLVALSAVTFDLQRVATILSLGTGGRRGFRIQQGTDNDLRLLRYQEVGAGPHRRAETCEDVGAIARPFWRLAAAAGVFAASACVLVTFMTIVLAQS